MGGVRKQNVVVDWGTVIKYYTWNLRKSPVQPYSGCAAVLVKGALRFSKQLNLASLPGASLGWRLKAKMLDLSSYSAFHSNLMNFSYTHLERITFFSQFLSFFIWLKPPWRGAKNSSVQENLDYLLTSKRTSLAGEKWLFYSVFTVCLDRKTERQYYDLVWQHKVAQRRCCCVVPQLKNQMHLIPACLYRFLHIPNVLALKCAIETHWYMQTNSEINSFWILVQLRGRQAQLKRRLTVIVRHGGSAGGWRRSIYQHWKSSALIFSSVPQGEGKEDRLGWISFLLSEGNCFAVLFEALSVFCSFTLQSKVPPTHHHQHHHLVVSA